MTDPYELLREVFDSGVELDDKRLRYVTIQIDRATWASLQAMFNPTHTDLMITPEDVPNCEKDPA